MPIENQLFEKLSSFELLAKQVVEGFITGLHKSPFHGFSVEFAEHRLYNKGESTRNIDWKLFARTEKLFIKRYEEETNLRCSIVLDNSSSMYYPLQKDPAQLKNIKALNKIGFGSLLAASIIYMLNKQADAFGLSLFSEHLEKTSEVKSTVAHKKMLFTELEKCIIQNTLNKKTNIGEIIHTIAAKSHKRSLVVLISDFLYNTEVEFEGIIDALQHLKHQKHEIIVFQVLEPSTEINFEFDNAPHVFVDMESGKEIKLNPTEIKEVYIKKISEIQKKLQEKCVSLKIEYSLCPTNKGFSDVFNTYLIKRQKIV